MGVIKDYTGFRKGVAIEDIAITSGSGAPTLATVPGAGRGSLYIDSATATIYRNVGTELVPLWTVVVPRTGMPSQQRLAVTGVVAGAETFTIGTTVFRIAIVNTDSTKNTVAAMAVENYTDNFVIAAHGLIAGDFIRVESEIMRVLAVRSASRVYLKRGVGGTTIATHVTNSDIYTEAALGGGNVGVPLVTTLTAAQFMLSAVATINDPEAHSGAYRAISPVAGVLLVSTADAPGGNPLASTATPATTETMTNGAWDGATMAAGYVDSYDFTIRVDPTAAESTAQRADRLLPVSGATLMTINIVTTATNARKVFDGVASVSGNVLSIVSSGAVDLATGDAAFVTLRV